jgi:hypothetical protein
MAQILDAAGNPVVMRQPAETGINGFTGSFTCGFKLRHTAADASGSVVVALHNPAASGKTLYLRRIIGGLFFDGTAAAGGLAYELIKFSGGDPTTGTTMAVSKKRTTYTSAIGTANAQYKSGILTVTGITNIETIAFTPTLGSATTNGMVPFEFNFVQAAGHTAEPYELPVDYGFAFRLPQAAIIGLGMSGFAEWDERTN